MRRWIGFVIISMAVIGIWNLVFAEQNKESSGAKVWMSHCAPQALAEDASQWKFVKQNLDVLEISINTIAFICPAEKLKSLVTILNENKIKIAIECGYFDCCNTCTDLAAPNPKKGSDTLRKIFDEKVGEETAHIEMRKIDNLIAAGGIPSYLNLDGPIRRMMHPGADGGRKDIKGYDSPDRCADELINYMRAWRVRFPQIQFFVITNFPNWGWKGDVSYWGGMNWGDYYPAIQKIISKTKAAGIPISGVTVDNPYEYAIGTHLSPDLKEPQKINWMSRILDLERYVKREGLRFNIIINSEIGGNTSAEAFYTETLKFLNAYRQAGGTPDGYIIQSWFAWPKKVIPESEPYTMTNLVKTVIEKVKFKKGKSI